MEIAWTVVGILVPFLLGLAWAFVGMTPAEFRAAKWCFWISAIVLGGMDLVWQLGTEKPLVFRVFVGVLIWSTIGVGLPEAIRWVNKRERAISAQKSASTPEHFNNSSAKPESHAQQTPKTIRELFDRQLDFPYALGTSKEYTFYRKGQSSICTVQAKLYADTLSHIRFIGFFIPDDCNTFDACRIVLQHYDKVSSELSNGIKVLSGMPGGNVEDIRTYPFSGRVVIYYEGTLTMREKGNLDEICTSRHLSLLLFDSDHLLMNYPRQAPKQQ